MAAAVIAPQAVTCDPQMVTMPMKLLSPAELRSMGPADIEKFVKDFTVAPQVQPPLSSTDSK